jgi:hypothetical protein
MDRVVRTERRNVQSQHCVVASQHLTAHAEACLVALTKEPWRQLAPIKGELRDTHPDSTRHPSDQRDYYFIKQVSLTSVCATASSASIVVSLADRASTPVTAALIGPTMTLVSARFYRVGRRCNGEQSPWAEDHDYVSSSTF